MPMPTIVRERSREGLRMVEVVGMPAMLVIARPKHGGQVLAVVDHETPAPTLRQLAGMLLPAEQRRHLSRFLDLRRKR